MKLEKKHWIIIGIVVAVVVIWYFFFKKKKPAESGYNALVMVPGADGWLNDQGHGETNYSGSEINGGTPESNYARRGGSRSVSTRPGASSKITGTTGDTDKGWCCKHAFPCTTGNWIKCGTSSNYSNFKTAGSASVTPVGPTPQEQINPCFPGGNVCYQCTEVDSKGNCVKSVTGCCNKMSGKWTGPLTYGFQ